ncbi:GNAT family N-acetyltransferase [Croceiramulus getboli]|nr:GNAT family N-acetyltransferase [Flavobacteriaceae bacterium YJPT1-3]
MEKALIRPIEKADNEAVARMVREVLIELGVPKVGTAYADEALDAMYETYDEPRAIYFVVEENGQLIGGAGIAQLANYEGNVCELQKMYFSPQARGRGLGKVMMQRCLDQAKAFGYEQVYLETMPYMKDAQELYKKTGFTYIDGPMGDTGHFSCPVHMLKSLSV